MGQPLLLAQLDARSVVADRLARQHYATIRSVVLIDGRVAGFWDVFAQRREARFFLFAP